MEASLQYFMASSKSIRHFT